MHHIRHLYLWHTPPLAIDGPRWSQHTLYIQDQGREGPDSEDMKRTLDTTSIVYTTTSMQVLAAATSHGPRVLVPFSWTLGSGLYRSCGRDACTGSGRHPSSQRPVSATVHNAYATVDASST